LQRKLSKAIYGNVYLVDLADPGTPADLVAVKRMPRQQVLSSQQRVESASNELHAACAIKTLDAPYVVNIVGAAQDYNFFYLVLEFCERGDLFTWLLRKGPVQQEPLLREIFWQILVAIRSLHREGIVHRDISLENVLIHGDGSLRLCDFGQALLVHAPGLCGEEVTVPQSDLGPPGKPEYRAPETQGTDVPYFAKVADAYSCGVVLLALATGMYPSDAASCAVATDPAGQELCQGEQLGLYLDSAATLGPGLKDLLVALLAPDPGVRATIEQALEHPWLLEGCSRLGDSSNLRVAPGELRNSGDVECKEEDMEGEGSVCSDGMDAVSDQQETWS